MDIIKRNFFNLLRSGSLNKYESLEPMSEFKWNRLFQMIRAQDVLSIALKGVKNHQYDEKMNIPTSLIDELQQSDGTQANSNIAPRLSNVIFNKRLRKIQGKERHAIDASIETLEILNIIVANVSAMLNYGISLRGIINLGKYLRTKGNLVDFVKLDNWLESLHLKRMAQLEGSFLIAVFDFEKDEIPFVSQIEPSAQKLIFRTVDHIATDTAKEWHFRQSKSGFVKNNSSVLRRNLRRSIRFASYAPIETTSNFVTNFARSLSEIEE